MNGAGRAAAAFAAAALVALTMAPSVSRASFPDGPPPAHTGGFGEPTCYACHFDSEPQPPAEALTIEGLPEAYAPGRTYPLTIRLTRPGMHVAGFELAARFDSGSKRSAQAGTLEPVTAAVAITPAGSSSIQYAHQTRSGSRLSMPDTARWIVHWIAPEQPFGSVVLHVAANAGNDDASPTSDFTYARAYTILAQQVK
jgi:hypothetical protein